MVNFEQAPGLTKDAGLTSSKNPVAPDIKVQENNNSEVFSISSLEVGGKLSYVADGLPKDAQVELPSFQPGATQNQENVLQVNAGMVRFGKSVLIFDAPVYNQLTLPVDEHVRLSRESKIELTNLLNNLPPGDFHIAIYAPNSDQGAKQAEKVEKELERHLHKSGDLIEITEDGIKKTALPIYRYVGREGSNQRVGIFVVGEATAEKGVHPGINRNTAADPGMFTESRDVGIMLKVGTSVGPAKPINEHSEHFGPVDPETGFSNSTYLEQRNFSTPRVGLSIGAKIFIEGQGATLTAELNHDFAQKLSQISIGLDFPIGYNYIAGPISLGFRANAGMQTGVTNIWRETVSSFDPTLMPGSSSEGISAVGGVSGVISAPDLIRKGLGVQGELGINWDDNRGLGQPQPFARLGLTAVLPFKL